jgi:predicted TIM-barrel fold metal-dependent hydrolase
MTTQAPPKTYIVDADGHVLEPPTALVDYVDPAYKDRAPHIVERDGKEYWEGDHWQKYGPPLLQSSQPSPATNVPGLAGVERWKNATDVGMVQGGMPYSQCHPASFRPGPRLEVMNSEGFDVAVLYPTLGLTYIPDPPYMTALNRAYNDWLADYCKADPKRLYGACAVNLQDVEAGIAELRRCVTQLGFKAAFLRPCQYIPGAEWWHPVYGPFWQAVEELDVAVGFHPFSVDNMPGAATFFNLGQPDPTKIFIRAPFVHPTDCMYTVCGLVAGGVLERHPNLRFAILEASGGWLVPILERLDHRFENLGQTIKDRMTMPATDYYKRQGWISFDPDEQTIEMTAHVLGADRLIFGSDFPHPDAFYPNFVPLMKERMSGLTAEEQRLILGENARAFYKLP